MSLLGYTVWCHELIVCWDTSRVFFSEMGVSSGLLPGLKLCFSRESLCALVINGQSHVLIILENLYLVVLSSKIWRDLIS